MILCSSQLWKWPHPKFGLFHSATLSKSHVLFQRGLDVLVLQLCRHRLSSRLSHTSVSILKQTLPVKPWIFLLSVKILFFQQHWIFSFATQKQGKKKKLSQLLSLNTPHRIFFFSFSFFLKQDIPFEGFQPKHTRTHILTHTHDSGWTIAIRRP